MCRVEGRFQKRIDWPGHVEIYGNIKMLRIPRVLCAGMSIIPFNLRVNQRELLRQQFNGL